MKKEHATPGVLLALILFALGGLAADVCAASYPAPEYIGPTPVPPLPSSVFAAYEPPIDLGITAASSPTISAWTRATGPGETMAIAGGGTPTDYVVYGPGSTNVIQAAHWFGTYGAAILPSGLPYDEMYLMWPKSGGSIGKPITINKTEGWWLTKTAHAGETFSIFGQNLGSDCRVWVEEKSEWLDAVACNSYKADFIVPADYENGTYSLWAHNRSGGKYGFSARLELEVEPRDQWDENPANWFNVKDYGAKGDGVSEDWYGAIEAAIAAADAVDWSTVYFPPGDYRIGSKLRCGTSAGVDKVRLVGAGMDLVTIQPHSSFVNSSWRNYLLQGCQIDFQLKGMTLKPNSYGGQQVVRLDPNSHNVLLDGVRLDQSDAVMDYPKRPELPLNTETSDKILGIYNGHDIRIENSEFIQKASFAFDPGSSQIFISNCTFIGIYDANTLITLRGCQDVSIVDSTASNLDSSASEDVPDTWCQGRWLHSKGGMRNLYFSGNTTRDMCPRTGYPDSNVGEQLMFEFAYTHFQAKPTSVTSTTMTFGQTPPSIIVGLVAVIQSGTGQGQNRIVTGLSGNTVTVFPAWDVTPDSTSTIMIGDYTKNVVVYDNHFDGRPRALGRSFVGNAGIEAYGGCVDLVADENTFTEVRFPYNVQSRATTGLFEPNFFNLFKNGSVSNCYHGFAMYTERDADHVWTYPQVLGNVYRKNTIKNPVAEPLHYHGSWGGQTGERIDMQIFDQNTYTNYPGSLIEYDRIDESDVVHQVTIEASDISPPPPDGPPDPVLTGVEISGPTDMDEESSAQYTFTASWSDGTSTTATPTWSEDSSYTSISPSGLLSAGNVASDQHVTLTATYGGMTATFDVTILYVAPVVTGITISGPVNVTEETTAQYTCTASWSDGTSTTVSPTWGENSSFTTINSSGLLSAGNVPADQNFSITASFGGQTDTHNVTIIYVAPSLAGITISGPTSVDEQTTAQYLCTASWDDGTTTTVAPTWSDNSGYVSINASGLLTAGNVTSDQNVTITASFGGQTDTQSVSIKYVAPTLSRITISGPTSVDEETSAQYSCTASWSDGTTTTVSPSWSENSAYATINASGLFTASTVSTDENVIITASYGGKTDTHALAIENIPATLTGITISGPTSVDEETTAQYSCTASWSDGTTTTVSPSWSENSAYATISASGLFTAGTVSTDENVIITASYGGKTDTHALAVENIPATLTGITISGPTSVDEETTAQYSCTASWSDGTTTTVSPSWSENSVYTSISSSGLLTAGNVPADRTVTISASYDGESDTHVVNVRYVEPPIELTGISISGPTEVEENATERFSCTAHYSDGTSETVAPTWSEDTSFTSIDTAGTLTVANIDSDASVTVTANYAGFTATRTVSVWMVGTKIVYPLSGFEGSLVRARLWDENAQAFSALGEMENPDELVLENLNTNQWYWIVFEEYNESDGEWVRVQANWISM